MPYAPGPTLSDAKGERRIRKLQDTRLNIWVAILAAQDKISCIDHEIEELMLQTAAARIRALVDRPDLGDLKAMEEIGWGKVPEVTQVIGMSETLKREYRIADNQTGTRSKWNPEDLLKEIEEIKLDDPAFQVSDIAFDQRDLDQMLHDLEDEKTEEDNFDPATIRPTDIRYGDIYQLGPHYCQGIIDRWEQFTGKTAEKVS